MALVSSLFFLLTSLAPFQKPPNETTAAYEASKEWLPDTKPLGKCLGATEPCCTMDEEWTECLAACKNRRNCTTLDKFIVCPPDECVSGCTCRPGKVRRWDGECVYPYHCRAHHGGFPQRDCQADEEWSLCQAGCKNRRNCTNLDKRIICPIECVSGCTCKQGKVRALDGQCVYPYQCNAHLGDTINVASQKNADDSTKQQPPKPKSYRDAWTNLWSSATDCGDENAEYTLCPRLLPETCDNYKDRSTVNSLVCRPWPGCQCKKGFAVGQDGRCITYDQCPEPEDKDSYICPKGEVLQLCGTACPKTCANYELEVSCLRVCVPGCFCKPPLIRDPSSGKCVLPEECYSESCPEGEVYQKCGTACPKNCSNYETDVPCIQSCVPGCFCEPPLIRHPSSGKCVRPEECDSLSATDPSVSGGPVPACGKNQEFSHRTSRCPDSCDNYRRPWRPCNAVQFPGCACKAGFIRAADIEDTCIPIDMCPY